MGHPADPADGRTLANCQRILGPEHPDTLTSRGNLASAYRAAGRLAESLPLYERALADADGSSELSIRTRSSSGTTSPSPHSEVAVSPVAGRDR